MPELSPMQRQYRDNANRRWNVKTGATRSGKTWMDIAYIIPMRIMAVKGKQGLTVLLGNTRGTLQRNVIEPMQEIFGSKRVSSIRSDNTAEIFGERVHCLGADNKKHVDRLRGSSIKYCYGDEVVTWNKEVFDMLKSRLDKPYSCFDGTCNPASPGHWFKTFLDSDADIYQQRYTLDDNPFLPPQFVDALKKEYAGTVYYGRYILGEWTQAEGMIYPMYIDALEKPFAERWQEYVISCDYGTQNAFAALLWARLGDKWHLIAEYRYSGRDTGHQKTDDDYVRDIERFVEQIPPERRQGLLVIIDPSAASFIAAIRRSRYGFRVRKADNDVLDGIRDTAVCMQRGTIRIFDTCRETIKEFEGYVWDAKAEDKPVKVDDHMMDALRYFVKTMRLVRPHEKPTSAFAAALMR